MKLALFFSAFHEGKMGPLYFSAEPKGIFFHSHLEIETGLLSFVILVKTFQ